MKPLEDFASVMFAVPGEWLLQQFIGASFEDEFRSALTITLGFVMWLGALLVALIVVRRVRSLARRPAVAVARTSPGIPRAGGMLATLQRQARAWTWRDAWGALWRAEAVHLVLYALVPLAWEMGRWALLIVFLPFTILSFADQKRGATDGTLDHLARPACWTFATPCAGPRSGFLHTPVIQASQCVNYVCPPGETKVPDSGGVFWKLLWAALTLAWVVGWLRRRGRDRGRAPGRPRYGS